MPVTELFWIKLKVHVLVFNYLGITFFRMSNARSIWKVHYLWDLVLIFLKKLNFRLSLVLTLDKSYFIYIILFTFIPKKKTNLLNNLLLIYRDHANILSSLIVMTVLNFL